MRKATTVLMFISLLFVIGGLAFYSYTLYRQIAIITAELENEKTAYPEIYDVINSITYDAFIDKANNREDFIVYVGRPTCSDCTKFEPRLIEMIEKYGLSQKIFYLNVTQVSNDDAKWELFKEKYEIQYTPTIVKMAHGKAESMVGWTPENGTDMDEIESYLKRLAEL